MKCVVFPGQGSQFVGMGADDYAASAEIKDIYHKANDILGFDIANIMFTGDEESLKRTDVTQPAVFIYSYSKYVLSKVVPDATAGHSLGEFTALVAAGRLTFEDGLALVAKRANAMQEACEANPGTMAAILGLEDEVIERICSEIEDIVVPANYNSPGQLVISGSLIGVEKAMEACKAAGAKRALPLPVGGAFHSPLMRGAEETLAKAIEETHFHDSTIAIYQNIDGNRHTDNQVIKNNLIKQLTGSVKWTHIMQNMLSDGMKTHVESGGKVLTGLLRKIDREVEAINA